MAERPTGEVPIERGGHRKGEVFWEEVVLRKKRDVREVSGSTSAPKEYRSSSVRSSGHTQDPKGD